MIFNIIAFSSAFVSNYRQRKGMSTVQFLCLLIGLVSPGQISNPEDEGVVFVTFFLFFYYALREIHLAALKKKRNKNT
jgi:hypothetical protein